MSDAIKCKWIDFAKVITVVILVLGNGHIKRLKAEELGAEDQPGIFLVCNGIDVGSLLPGILEEVFDDIQIGLQIFSF